MTYKVFRQEVKKIHKKRSFLLLVFLVLIMTMITVFVYKDLKRIALTGAPGIERLSSFMIELLSEISNIEFSKIILRDLLLKTPMPIGTMLLLVIVFDIFGNEKKEKIIENTSMYTHTENNIIYGKIMAVVYMVCFVLFLQLVAAYILSIPLLGVTIKGFYDLVKTYSLLILPYTSILIFAGFLSLIISNKAILYLVGFVGIVVLSIISPRFGYIHLLPTNIFTLVNQGDVVNISLRDSVTINVVSSISICLTILCTKVHIIFVRKTG